MGKEIIHKITKPRRMQTSLAWSQTTIPKAMSRKLGISLDAWGMKMIETPYSAWRPTKSKNAYDNATSTKQIGEGPSVEGC